MQNKIVTITLILLLVLFFLLGLFACNEMQIRQLEKEKIATIEGIKKNIKIYEAGKLVDEFNGKFNLEFALVRDGILTFTEIIDGEFFMHKVKTSYQTLIIIKELK